MKPAPGMQRVYFLRKLATYLACITLPIILTGLALIVFMWLQLEKEFSAQARRNKETIEYTVNSSLNIFSETSSLFSSTPSLAIAVSKLLNEEALDYRNNAYRSMVSQLIDTSANSSSFVDSIYIYFPNPAGNFLSSHNEYTNITATTELDRDWLTLYEEMPAETTGWAVRRQVQYWSFEAARDTLSLFRRLHSQNGVMVLNLNLGSLSDIMAASQMYAGAGTMLLDGSGTILLTSGSLDSGAAAAFPLRALGNGENDVDTITLNGTKYLYFSSPVEGYALTVVSLIPRASVFSPLNSMLLTLSLILILSIVISIGLSLTITRTSFSRLNGLIELFHKAEHGEIEPVPVHKPKSEYDLILNSTVRTFVTKNALQLDLAQAQVKERDTRLAALQLQLNPHFIFNTLQTIDIELLRNLPPKNIPSAVVHQLADILQYSLENTGKTVHLRDEIAICKTYAEIQRLRYDTPFILYWDYDEAALDASCIHLILQPLLENSLHHGIKNLPRKGLVKIKVYRQGGFIKIRIIDNGLGIPAAQLQEIRKRLNTPELHQNTHIGIYNTNLRLVLTYGPESAIHINSKPAFGTCVYFQIPL